MPEEETQQEHDPEQVLLDFAEKLAARRRHIAFLFGAGTSCAAGLPDLAGLAQAVGERLEGAQKNAYDQLSATRNIEEVLTHLRLIAAVTRGTDQEIDGLSATAARELDRLICSTIAKVILETEATLEHHQRFGRWAARSRYDAPVEIFTTNYDLHLELGLERAGAPYFDGFVGVIRGGFRTDLVDPPTAASPPRESLPAAWTRLWKLHGSVSWVEGEEEGIIQRLGGGSPPEPDRVLAIYPSLEKYVESRRLPFVALADRFRRSLATPESLVVVCGYSFGDAHINDLLFEAARLHPRSETVVLSYDAIPDLVAEHAEELPNVTVIGRHEGIIGTIRARWREPASTSIAWDDGVRLGDFTVLSRVLGTQGSGSEDGETNDGST